MDIARILAELKKQRSALDVAIAALEGRNRRSRNSSRKNAKGRAASSQPAPKAKARIPETTGKLIPFRRLRRLVNSPPQIERA